MADEQIDKAVLENIDKAGSTLKGDSWALALGGHARSGGIQPQKMQEYLREPNVVEALYHDGKERLLAKLPSATEASTNDPASIQAAKQAEVEYARIRQAEREAYAKMKGRR